jgi:hypothetical protein
MQTISEGTSTAAVVGRERGEGRVLHGLLLYHRVLDAVYGLLDQTAGSRSHGSRGDRQG